MNNQHVINGFVKAAQQHGLNEQEINALVKHAAPDPAAIWEAIKGGAGHVGNFAKREIYDPVHNIPLEYKSIGRQQQGIDEWAGVVDQQGLHKSPEGLAKMQAYLQELKNRRNATVGRVARGVGTAGAGLGVAGLGAYGAGKALSYPSRNDPSNEEIQNYCRNNPGASPEQLTSFLQQNSRQ